MMLLERWLVVVMLGMGLMWTAPYVRGQSCTGKGKVVQPDKGPPPDEAVPSAAPQPDPATLQNSVEVPDTAVPDMAVPDTAPTPDTAALPEPTAPSEQTAPLDMAVPPLAPAAQSDTAASEPAAESDTGVQPGPVVPPSPVAAAAPAPAPVEPPPVASTAAASAEQRQLQTDTARLLQLVEELKLEIEKAGSNTLSLVAVRKAEEIQRLTKALKDKMSEHAQGFVSK